MFELRDAVVGVNRREVVARGRGEVVGSAGIDCRRPFRSTLQRCLAIIEEK